MNRTDRHKTRCMSPWRLMQLPQSVASRDVKIVWYFRVNVCIKCGEFKGVYIATRLNSTQLNWPSWTAYRQVSRVFVYDVMTYNWVTTTFIDRWQLFTLWTRRRFDVELSWVELCRYKRAFTQWAISLFGIVFRWDQRLRSNASTLVLVRSLH